MGWGVLKRSDGQIAIFWSLEYGIPGLLDYSRGWPSLSSSFTSKIGGICEDISR